MLITSTHSTHLPPPNQNFSCAVQAYNVNSLILSFVIGLAQYNRYLNKVMNKKLSERYFCFYSSILGRFLLKCC